MRGSQGMRVFADRSNIGESSEDQKPFDYERSAHTLGEDITDFFKEELGDSENDLGAISSGQNYLHESPSTKGIVSCDCGASHFDESLKGSVCMIEQSTWQGRESEQTGRQEGITLSSERHSLKVWRESGGFRQHKDGRTLDSGGAICGPIVPKADFPAEEKKNRENEVPYRRGDEGVELKIDSELSSLILGPEHENVPSPSTSCDACHRCNDICGSMHCRGCLQKQHKILDSLRRQPTGDRYYSYCEVKRHSQLDSCWIVAYGNVYDCTSFIKLHPGGMRCLLARSGGEDCTQDMDFHSKRALKLLRTYKIGRIYDCRLGPAERTEQCLLM